MSNLYVEDIDDDLWELLDADHRSKKQIVQAALWEHFGGRKKSALEAKLEHKRDQLTAIQNEIEAEMEDRDRVEREINAIQNRIEELDDASEAYGSDLDEVLDATESGEREMRIIPATLEDIATRHGKDPDQVHQDIKDRALRQERNLYTTAFVESRKSATVEKGPITEVWEVDDE